MSPDEHTSRQTPWRMGGKRSVPRCLPPTAPPPACREHARGNSSDILGNARTQNLTYRRINFLESSVNNERHKIYSIAGLSTEKSGESQITFNVLQIQKTLSHSRAHRNQQTHTKNISFEKYAFKTTRSCRIDTIELLRWTRRRSLSLVITQVAFLLLVRSRTRNPSSRATRSWSGVVVEGADEDAGATGLTRGNT